MKGLNKAMLIGYTTADPEIRVTPKGVKVAHFSLATSKNNDKKKDDVEFHRVVAWKGLAEVVESYIKKGKGLFVEGEIQNRSWEDKDGIKKYSTEIIADNINMLTYDKK